LIFRLIRLPENLTAVYFIEPAGFNDASLSGSTAGLPQICDEVTKQLVFD
jgi:hypothetical protein